MGGLQLRVPAAIANSASPVIAATFGLITPTSANDKRNKK
jgi:hypothetical protein